MLALLIAIPISNLVMRSWLANYEYHTEIFPLILLIPYLGSLAITILTVSYQAVKAAFMNPVKSLRSE